MSKVFHRAQKRIEDNDDIPVVEVAKMDKNVVHDDILVGRYVVILHASISKAVRIQWLSFMTSYYLFTIFIKVQSE